MSHATASRAPAESSRATDAPPSPRALLLRHLVGNQIQQAIHVTAVLGVADVLAAGPLPIGELAAAVDASGPALGRLLATLASFGIFEQQADGRFALTPAAALLRRNVPQSLRPFAVWSGGVCYQAFGGLDRAVRTGQPAFEELFGMDFFEYLDQHPDVGDLFDDVMSWNTAPLGPVAAARDFSRVRTVVDLGGGRGELLAAVLAAHPHVHARLVDRRAAAVPQPLAKAARESRCEVIRGDILEGVPAGADLYLLKNVLHGLDDSDALRVLRNCHRAMNREARLLVIELLLPDGSGPSPARLMDLLMLVGCHGRERTRGEFDLLFSRAGFGPAVVQPAAQAFSIMELGLA